jgi:hypothetical protein
MILVQIRFNCAQISENARSGHQVSRGFLAAADTDPPISQPDAKAKGPLAGGPSSLA